MCRLDKQQVKQREAQTLSNLSNVKAGLKKCVFFKVFVSLRLI